MDLPNEFPSLLSNILSPQDDIEFTRYMAENFATLEYKTLEEVLTILKYLTNVLSTSGMQILEKLSPSNLLVQLHSPFAPTNSPNTVSGSLCVDELFIYNQQTSMTSTVLPSSNGLPLHPTLLNVRLICGFRSNA